MASMMLSVLAPMLIASALIGAEPSAVPPSDHPGDKAAAEVAKSTASKSGADATEAAKTVGGNLLANGDFSAADAKDATRPAHWDQPDGLGVQWLAAPDGTGKAIRVDTAISEQAMVAQWKKVGITMWDIPKASGGAVAETYGLSLYSESFPIEAKASYRLSYDFQGNAGGVKVWVRGYGLMKNEKRRLYEAVINGLGSGAGWHTVVHDFHPTEHTPAVTEMKVMLFAYYPAAVYWFRNVKIEKLADKL